MFSPLLPLLSLLSVPGALSATEGRLLGEYSVAPVILCERPVSESDLLMVIDRAESSFRALDEELFKQDSQIARALLPCLTDPISSGSAARLLRLVGIDSFVQRDEARAMQAFASARELGPDLPPAWELPDDHPLARAWRAMDSQACPADPLPMGGRETFLWNGERQGARHPCLPGILQVIDARDQVVHSSLVEARAALPLALWLPRSLMAEPAARQDHHRRGFTEKTRWLAIGTGAAALTTGALVGLNANAGADFETRPHTATELQELQARVNGLYWAAIGAGALTGGFGIFTLFSYGW